MQLIGTEDIRLIVELGFVALSSGQHDAAETIFKGVEVARPMQDVGPLGLAMVDMARDALEPAIKRLQALPPGDAPLTYLAIALARRGDVADARAMLETVAATATDPAFQALAAAALSQIGENTHPSDDDFSRRFPGASQS